MQQFARSSQCLKTTQRPGALLWVGLLDKNNTSRFMYFAGRIAVDLLSKRRRPMEKIAYALLVIAALSYVGLIAMGLLGGGLPLVLLLGFGLGIGLLLIKVISDRLSNKEDDYYHRNVEK
jgi:fatty acid desaturase